MLLTDILAQDAPDIDITGISADSRTVSEGFLFVALSGAKADGSQFIESAIKNGARVIVSAPGITFPHDPAKITHITTEEPRLLLSQMAARFYATQPETIVAVTGTNGKTSTAHFCRMIWQELGMNSASIGTIGVMDKENSFAKENGASLTTPDPVTLHRLLSSMEAKNIQHVAMEASSHGLDQYRLDGVKIQAAAFTNLSRDHLDYHHSYENYLNAKMGLFERVMQPKGVAVLNADIPEYEEIAARCRAKGHSIISYGWQGKDLTLLKRNPKTTGQHVEFRINEKDYSVDLPLVGEFQVMNILTALGLVIATGVKAADAVSVLERLPSVPGRMEKVPGSSVFVDYAHTPDALEKALLALRPHTATRLLVVFGCGGDRDKGKRPQMGRIAAELADLAIITDDNPRTEDAATIRQEVLAGCDGGIEIADREEAIATAVSTMQRGDILLIAGKGHEKTQIMRDKTIPFDDLAIAILKLKEIGK